MAGVIVCPEQPAALAGVEAFALGGNAVDAAISCAFAQGVLNPRFCGLGGVGVANVWHPPSGRHVVVQFWGAVGSRAVGDIYGVSEQAASIRRAEAVGRWPIAGDANQIGYGSITVPGFVRGVSELHREFGRLPWAELPLAAAHLARAGHRVSPYSERTFLTPSRPGYPGAQEILTATPAAAALYTRDGRPLRQGALLVQSDLARTLEAIARDGGDDLYEGALADAMMEDLERNGAFLTAADLRGYRPVWEVPLRGRYKGFEILTAGPPAAGTTLLEMLNLFALALARGSHEPGTAGYIDRVARAQRLAFLDEARFLDDPAHVRVPAARLIGTAYARRRVQDLESDGPGGALASRPASGTTHVIAADDEGTVVALTHTLGMGSGVVTSGIGFMYNNFMGQFSPVPGTAHAFAPGKRRGGTVPTIMFRSGRPAFALGASGGSRITSAIAQVIHALSDLRVGVQEAVSRPRVHLESDTLFLDDAWAPDLELDLQALGWRTERSDALAVAHALRLHADVARCEGGSDHRGGGGAVFFGSSRRGSDPARA